MTDSRADNADASAGSDREWIEHARRQVEEAAAQDDATFSVPPPPGPEAAGLKPDSLPGYTIVREIHRGGQGVVYQAVQQATRRKVAIKAMKEGPFASRAEQARFDREVHILGQLNHPNIVAIHDSGIAAGVHYFVMDYVRGQPLDVWMQSPGATDRTIEDTLRLFVRICDAVNAAHLHGIIHRDLKPGNIRIDADGEPHVLDFGLAKTATAEGEPSVMTMTGQFVGSLPWASPEQAEAIPGKIDVRTDVYSLGVILYQMLTGRFPYNVIGNLHDVLDRIMHEEPVRPHSVCRQINDEVQTIVLKCLNKEPVRRYQTAGELARDIRHYLAGEPIEAKRDSAGYLLRKRLRRHRVAVGVVLLFVLTLVGALIVSIGLWQQAEKQRQLAEQQQREAEQQAAVASEALAQLTELFEAFSPRENPAQPDLKTLIAEAERRLTQASVGSPLVEAEMRLAVARLLGANADEQQRAHAHRERALELRREVLGERHVKVAEAWEELAYDLKDKRKQRECYQRALSIYREALGEDHPKAAKCLFALAGWHGGQGQDAESMRLANDALAALDRWYDGKPNYDTALMLFKSAQLRPLELDGAAQVDYVDRARRMTRALPKSDQIRLAKPMADTAWAYLLTGAETEGIRAARDALTLIEESYPEDHYMVTQGRWTLAGMLTDFGRCEEAEPLYRQVIAAYEENWTHVPHVFDSHMAGFAKCLLCLDRLDEAELSLNRVLEIRLKKLGPDSWGVGSCQSLLGALHLRRGEYEAAEQLLLEAVEKLAASAGAQIRTVDTMERLVRLYDEWGKPDQADAWRVRLDAATAKLPRPE